MTLNVAAIQLNAGRRKEDNIDKAKHMVEAAIRRGADLIAMPEVFNYRGPLFPRAVLDDVAERIPGESLQPLIALAKKHRVYILAGSVYERIPGHQKCYNTSVLIDYHGHLAARYRKRNLFEAVVDGKYCREADHCKAGRQTATARVRGFTLGLSICYDVRFADMYRRYRRKGVDLVTVPSSFTRSTGRAHWEVLLRARAIEHLCYVVAPNQVGRDARGVACYGNSLIVDPWGQIVARASSHKEEIIYARLRPSVIKKVRKEIVL